MAVAAKRHGVRDATIYILRKVFGQLDTNEVKRLKFLDAENARREELLVDRDLEIEVVKKSMQKMANAQVWLKQVRYVVMRGPSQRRGLLR